MLTHAFSSVWSLPVTWKRWQSHHWIQHTRKPHATNKPHGFIFIEPELRAIEVYIAGISSTFFAPVTLTSTRWPSLYNVTRIPRRYTGCANMNFLHQGFWKLSHRHTDIHIDMTEIIYHTGSQVVNNHNLPNSLIWSFRYHTTELRQSTIATSGDWHLHHFF